MSCYAAPAAVTDSTSAAHMIMVLIICLPSPMTRPARAARPPDRAAVQPPGEPPQHVLVARTEQRGQIADRAQVGLGHLALPVYAGLLDLQVCERLRFPDSLAGKISTSLALLIGQLHCHGGAAAVRRFLDSDRSLLCAHAINGHAE